MTTDNYEKLIDLYVPNFRRFEDKLDFDSEELVDIAIMLKKTYDAGLLETIGKKINLELGLCILKDEEIDSQKLKEIIRSFR